MEYDVLNNFSSHKADAEGVDHMGAVRSSICQVAIAISSVCPEGRELSIVRTKLEEAMFWANAGIARKFPKA